MFDGLFGLVGWFGFGWFVGFGLVGCQFGFSCLLLVVRVRLSVRFVGLLFVVS